MQDPAAPVATTSPRAVDSSRLETKPDTIIPARMTVAGRVLDLDGKPVAGAVVDLVTRPRAPWVGAREETGLLTLLGQGQSGGDGRYSLDAPRTASIRASLEVVRKWRTRPRVPEAWGGPI